MIFGKERDKGLVLDGMKLKVVSLTSGDFTTDDLLVHDAHENNPGIHTMLSNMRYPDYPVALGVIRQVSAVSYDESIVNQISKVQQSARFKNMNDLLFSGNTWEVKE